MGILDFFKQKKNNEWEAYQTDDLVLPDQITSHFRRIAGDNVRLIVQLDSEKSQYQSFFGGLAKNENAILIDELIPKEGNVRVPKSKYLRIYYSLDGAKHSFASRYIGVEIGQFESFKLELPQRIKVKQKRKAYRVSTSKSLPMYIDLGGRGVEEVDDISIGGLSFLTLLNLDIYRTEEEPLEFVLDLRSQKIKVRVKAVVRQFKRNAVMKNGKSRHKCSLEFIGLKEEESSAIARYVMERQRKLLTE